jgi:hypothetical protein
MPQWRDAIEAEPIPLSFFRPSTLRCDVGGYIDVPDSIMIRNSCYSFGHLMAEDDILCPLMADGTWRNIPRDLMADDLRVF